MMSLLVTGQFAPELVPIEILGSEEHIAVLSYHHSMVKNLGKYGTIGSEMLPDLRDGTMKTSWKKYFHDCKAQLVILFMVNYLLQQEPTIHDSLMN